MMQFVMQNSGRWARMFRRGALGCVMALTLIAPAQARDWSVQDGAGLTRIAAQLVPGDVVELAAGDYHALDLQKLAGRADAPITFRSKDPGHRARIAAMDLREVRHLVFEDLAFDYIYRAGDKAGYRPFALFCRARYHDPQRAV